MVGNAFRVLDLFYDAEGEMGLQHVTRETGITKSSAFRILCTLEELGYVVRSAQSGKYRLGRRLLEAAARAKGRRTIVQVAQPHMRELHTRFGETVNLGALQGNQVVYLETIEGSFAFRLSASVGAVAPFHASALGKAILAYQPAERLKELLPKTRLERFTPRTITTREKLVEALAKIRQQGFALDAEEIEPQATCIGAAIVDPDGRATHALSVAGPTHRVLPRRSAIVADLATATAAIARDLAETGG